MAYRLSTDGEPLSRQLHRILLEQIDSAIAHLSNSSVDVRDTAIHEARKDIKKVRALLRLIAHQLSKPTFRAENHRLRNIGRQLSPVRDAQAIIESVVALPEGTLPKNSRDALLERLLARKADLYNTLDVSKIMASAVADLKADVRPALEQLRLKGYGYDAFETGILSTYRRGRKALKTARQTGSSNDRHDLRKRVKDHVYQIRLLQTFNVDYMQLRQALVREVECLLGEANNLHVLRHTMLEGKTSEGFSAPLIEREAELNADALAQADGLYRLETHDFKKKLSGLQQLLAKQDVPHKPPAHEVAGPSAEGVRSKPVTA